MKKYIKPTIASVNLQIESLMEINSVTGLDGVKRGGEFGGGDADSRLNEFWDEEN
jgi:hypothetical protein